MRSAPAAELRNGKLWMKTAFGHAGAAAAGSSGLPTHSPMAKANGKLTNAANESTLWRARCAVAGFKS